MRLEDYDDMIRSDELLLDLEFAKLPIKSPKRYVDDEIPKWYAEGEQQTPRSARISMAPPDDG